MIRFLIHTTVRKRDSYGDCYNFSTVTATKTGKSLTINSGWGSDGGNVKALVRDVITDYSEMNYTEEVLPCRQFDRCKPDDAIHEGKVLPSMLLDLEKES